MARVTVQTIAREANVSVGTVDRALNNRGRINEETRRRILEIADQLGYHPNKIASALGRLGLGRLLLLENLGIGGLPNAEDLFLGGNFRFLLDGLGLLFCAVEYLIGLGLCLSELAACALSGEKQGESRTNDRCSDCNDNVHNVHVLPPGFV